MTNRLMRFIAAIVVMALAGLFPGVDGLADTKNADPLWGPYITGTTETHSVINWKTDELTWGVVQYATEAQRGLQGGYDDFVIAPDLRRLHKVRLTDLQPATRYCYRIWKFDADIEAAPFPPLSAGSIEEWLRDKDAPPHEFTFETLGALPFTFIVYGDSQEQYPWFTQLDRHKLVADYIAQEEGISFIVHVGDFTYDADFVAGWDMFFEAGRDMLANNTIFPVLGNHENNSPVYFEIFGMPRYYSFPAGNAHFFVLDSNSWADFEAQRSWLQDELLSPSNWSFVFFHHPPYSSDSRNYGGWELARNHWEELFVRSGVTAVFSGHVHAYERYLVRGVNYLVVGTGGGALTQLSPQAPPGNQTRLERTLGYSKVTVDREEVTVDLLKVARISDDNREVMEIFPFGTVYETVIFQPHDEQRHLYTPEGDFKVSPASLDITVESRGSELFSMRISSSHDAQIYIGTEDLPFEVQPATFRIQGSEHSQRFDFELLGNSTVPLGQYEGKLTFLRDVGDNVALGVKVRTSVNLTGEGTSTLKSRLENNLYLIIAVLFIVAANIGGYLAYRKQKARSIAAKGVK